MNCNNCKSHLPELLLDSSAPRNLEVQNHLQGCPDCREELRSLQQTLDILDLWKSPEPTPWFDQKLAVLLREEQARPSESWLEKIQSYLLFNTGRQLRPVLAGALALTLLIGGGTFAGINGLPHSHSIQASAAVNDLQIFDKNAQAVQQMDQLLQDDDPADDTPVPQPVS